jgi:hypothetical protein
MKHRGAAAAIVLVALAGAAACDGGSASSVAVNAAQSPVSAPQHVVMSVGVATPTATHASPATTAARATANRHGEVVLAGGAILPNRALTPGATNPAVTPSTIHATICLTGYTKTVRPSSSYTTGLKRTQLAAGYTFHGDLSTSDYEEDHLISLELGGSPSSVKNLWPEPYAASEGARVKDKVENRLHDLVCSGEISLRTAQTAIATNWWSAYQRYGGAGVPSAYDGSYTAPSGATSSNSGGSTSSATAQCRDGSYSYSQHRSGTCSHHGGVDHWINPPPA